VSIDWDAQPLGETPDSALADGLGVSRSAVTAARRRRQIPPWRERNTIDWDSQPLGEVQDPIIAKRLGTRTEDVYAARKRRGIPSFMPNSKRSKMYDIFWGDLPLGETWDAEVARSVGRTPSEASRARRRFGIPAYFRTVPCDFCGEPFNQKRADNAWCSHACCNMAWRHAEDGAPPEIVKIRGGLTLIRREIAKQRENNHVE